MRRPSCAFALALLLPGCGEEEHPADGSVELDAAPDAARARWGGGPVDALVIDPGGAPVTDAIVLTGGSLSWVLTDAAGQATVLVGDDGVSDRWLIAARPGWRVKGTDLDEDVPPAGAVTITIEPLPEADNGGYVFGEGGDSTSPNTLYCGHCHREIADGWNASRHHEALSNPSTRDLWNGTALSADESRCADLGGRWLEGGVGGTQVGTEAHCYVGRGVLPDLNDGCGHDVELPCDHPDVPPGALRNLGHCGDCHGAAIPGAVPGHVDLNDAVGYTFAEGVSCDLCHKIADVTVGPAPGLDGAIHLKRPSEPSASPLTDFEPIMFGPYPDVLNPFMGASYQPQFRSAELCSACHEFAQEPLRPEDEVLLDRDRWPDGVAVHTTYGEWAASSYAPATTCQSCHMPPLDLDTSIGNLSDFGVGPGLAAGWLRAPGEVRAHTFAGPRTLGADAVDLQLSLAEVGDTVEVRATLSNIGAGHALPTGEPLRQVGVLITATMDGVSIAAEGGRAMPDVGGSLVQRTVGVDASFDGALVTLAGASLDALGAAAIRVARPTGEWDDYEGPGVGWFSDPLRTPEERNAEIEEYVDEIGVTSASGDTLMLAREPAATLAGDRVYLVDAEEWAGAPGALYSKILVDALGNRAVPHYRAVGVASDNRIAPHGEGTSVHVFGAPAPGQELIVTGRVLLRQAADAVAREYGWAHQDIELLTVERRLAR